MSSFISKKIDCICSITLQVYLTSSFGITSSFGVTLPSFKIKVGLMSSLKAVSSDTIVLKYSPPFFSKRKISKSNF